jgi:hypothetical protein
MDNTIKNKEENASHQERYLRLYSKLGPAELSPLNHCEIETPVNTIWQKVENIREVNIFCEKLSVNNFCKKLDWRL